MNIIKLWWRVRRVGRRVRRLREQQVRTLDALREAGWKFLVTGEGDAT